MKVKNTTSLEVWVEIFLSLKVSMPWFPLNECCFRAGFSGIDSIMGDEDIDRVLDYNIVAEVNQYLCNDLNGWSQQTGADMGSWGSGAQGQGPSNGWGQGSQGQNPGQWCK